MDYIIKRSPSVSELFEEGLRKGRVLSFLVEGEGKIESVLELILTGMECSARPQIDRNLWEFKGYLHAKAFQELNGELYLTPVPGNALGSLIVNDPQAGGSPPVDG